MQDKRRCKSEHNHHQRRRHHRGPSSYSMHDSEFVFQELKLAEGDFFLDLGCGAGDYAIRAAQMVGDSGLVFALDIWDGVIDHLTEEATFQGLKNIKPMVTDITGRLPIEDNTIDVCFIATVLHAMDFEKNKKNLFNEIQRVLKPNGRLAIIECQKEDQPFGPRMQSRLSPEELTAIAIQSGFQQIAFSDLGYNYLIQFAISF